MARLKWGGNIQMSVHAVKSTAAAPVERTEEQELWGYKHTLSRKIQRPLVELNLMLSEAAKRGVFVSLAIVHTDLNAPFIDASVFTSDD
jgi:hypothetical protein